MGYNVDEVYQGTSDHLKADDLGQSMPTYTIAGVDQKTFDNGDMKLVLVFHDTDKSLVLNVTNARAIRDMYSPDTDAWAGKQIMLFSMPVEFEGKRTNGIRVRAPQNQGSVNVSSGVGQTLQYSPQRPLSDNAQSVQAAVDNMNWSNNDGGTPPVGGPEDYGLQR